MRFQGWHSIWWTPQSHWDWHGGPQLLTYMALFFPRLFVSSFMEKRQGSLGTQAADGYGSSPLQLFPDKFQLFSLPGLLLHPLINKIEEFSQVLDFLVELWHFPCVSVCSGRRKAKAAPAKQPQFLGCYFKNLFISHEPMKVLISCVLFRMNKKKTYVMVGCYLKFWSWIGTETLPSAAS